MSAVSSGPGGPAPRRAALFVTCLADTLFPDVGRATTAVLERLGVVVDFPEAQTCCGQPQINTGYQQDALPIIEHFLRVFEDHGAIVAPSGSCVGTIRHLYPTVARARGDEQLARRVEAVGRRTFELSQYIVEELGVIDVGASFPYEVTYHPTCHSLRMLRVGDAPTLLLRAVQGLELVDLPDADECCGFGGTFAVKNAATSSAMLSDKLDAVRASGATHLVASDSSCLMHIRGGLSRADDAVRTVHLAEVLASTAPSTGAGA